MKLLVLKPINIKTTNKILNSITDAVSYLILGVFQAHCHPMLLISVRN